MERSGDDTTCPRCAGPAEKGQVTAGAGMTGRTRMAKLGWLPRRPTRGVRGLLSGTGETLWESPISGPARAPAHRCRRCRLVWFEYPAHHPRAYLGEE